MLDPRTFVRSVTHGRARIRHASLKGLSADEAKVIADMVEGFDGITSVSINPRVGSLLVTWDESQTNAEALLQAAEEFGTAGRSCCTKRISCMLAVLIMSGAVVVNFAETGRN